MTTKQQKQAPNGIRIARDDDDRHHYYVRPSISVDSMYVGRTHVEKGAAHSNTFDAVEKHEKLENGEGGVRFNVETLPAPLDPHRNKIALSRSQLLESLAHESAESYNKDKTYKKHFQGKDIRVEAAFQLEGNQKLVHVGADGFFIACLTAFAQHLPLQLAPDHVWKIITYAFARHVETNAEALRKKFVQHEGKLRLFVETSIPMSQDGDPDSGASARDWETIVFPGFSKQIREHIGEKTHDTITADFSTTSAACRAANEITLMSAMKHYFSCGGGTCCGIPDITLQGSEEDWIALRTRAEALGDLMLPEFSAFWMPKLLPVLDEFVESYKGNVNHGFWQSMVKLRHTAMGSGDHPFISGWIQILYPYLASGRRNERMREWQDMYFVGPKPGDFPRIMSSAPVDWNYYGSALNFDFHAGFAGMTQDPTSGALAPVVGWYITHAPPKAPRERLVDVKAEIEALLKGHKEDVAKTDGTEPWCVRVEALRAEQKLLEQKLLGEVKTELNSILKGQKVKIDNAANMHPLWYKKFVGLQAEREALELQLEEYGKELSNL